MMSDFFAEDGFDARDVEPVSNDFELIPAGTFVRAHIIEASQQPISSQNEKGDCLVLVWQVVDGQFANRQIWQRLNVKARNFAGNDKKSGEQVTADAISRARAELSAVCHAVGVPAPTRNEDILFRAVEVKIGINKSKDPQYKDQNTVIIPKAALEGASASSSSSPARVTPAANQPHPATMQPKGNVPAFMQRR